MTREERIQKHLSEGKTQKEAINLAYDAHYKENPPQQFQQGGQKSLLKSQNVNATPVDMTAQKEMITADNSWLQNWYQNRVIPDPVLNDTYQKEKSRFVNLASRQSPVQYVDEIDELGTEGEYDRKTKGITLLNNSPKGVYTHEKSHGILIPLQDTQTLKNAFNTLFFDKDMLPKEKIEDEWVKNNYNEIGNYKEVIPRLNSYRQKYDLKPDQVITPELIKQNRDNYKNNPSSFETNTDQLYKMFEDEGLSNVLNKVVSVDKPILNYAQQGGTVEEDNKWLQDWYGNRVIPNQRIQQLYEEDKPTYLERLKNIPPITNVDLIDNDVNKTGQYQSDTNKLLTTPRAQPSVYTHEANHYLNSFPSAMRTAHENIVEENMYKKGDPRLGVNNKYYDYLRNPDEIHSRIQVLRKDAGFKPNEEVKQEKLLNYLQNYKGNDDNILQIMNLTDNKGLLNMLNTMAEAPKKEEVQYLAQQGGTIKYTQNELNFIKELAQLR